MLSNFVGQTRDRRAYIKSQALGLVFPFPGVRVARSYSIWFARDADEAKAFARSIGWTAAHIVGFATMAIAPFASPFVTIVAWLFLRVFALITATFIAYGSADLSKLEGPMQVTLEQSQMHWHQYGSNLILVFLGFVGVLVVGALFNAILANTSIETDQLSTALGLTLSSYAWMAVVKALNWPELRIWDSAES